MLFGSEHPGPNPPGEGSASEAGSVNGEMCGPFKRDLHLPNNHVPSTASTPVKSTSGVNLRKVLGNVVLRLQGIAKEFELEGSDERVVALRDISLCEDEGDCGFDPIRQGEFVMIRGPSGGGKTTLLNIIGTLDSPTRGSISLMGHVIDKNSSDEELADLRLKHLGFVFQTFNLISTMTAAENVELPMTLIGTLSEKERRVRARQLLALVGLRNRVDHLPSELSGGEQQRVTIARSLANNPSILLLDEPTGDLDTSTTIEVMNLLLRLNRMVGTTLIMVTHNPDVECYADRILYVADGTFRRQAVNTDPMTLDGEAYQAYLHARESAATTL
jgi:putative ABC transport system ATP-binding protein